MPGRAGKGAWLLNSGRDRRREKPAKGRGELRVFAEGLEVEYNHCYTFRKEVSGLSWWARKAFEGAV